MEKTLPKLGAKRQITTLVALTLVIGVIFSLFYLAARYIAQQDTRSLSEVNHDVTISSSYFVDDSATLSVVDIKAKVDDFVSATTTDIPFKLGKANYWVKFDLKNLNDNSHSLVLHIDNAMLATAQVFDIDKNSELKLGDINVQSAFPTFELELPMYASRSLLLKMRAAGPPDIPLVWYQKTQYQTKEQLTRLLFGAVIGVLAIMGLYNLIIFAAIRDKVYLAYIGYLISSFVVLATVNGYGYLLFNTEIQQWLNGMSLFFHYYLVIFLLLFGLLFLKYNEHKGWLYRLGIYGTFTLITLSFITQFLAHETQANIFFSLVPIFYGYSLLLLALRVSKQFYWARFYALSWVSLLCGAAIQPLVLLNHLDYSFLLRNAFLIAVVAEVVLMAFALAERVRRHEVDRMNEISYHPATGIVRKVLLEKTIRNLMKQPSANFSVLVIKPEHIERIALYVNDAMNTELFKRMHKKLAPLFAYNDAVVPIAPNGEKIAFIAGNSLGLVVDHQNLSQPLATMIKSINTLVEEAYQIDNLNIPLKATIGVANYPEHGTEAFVLINRAQLALPQAELNQSRWSYFTEHQSDKTSYRLQLASDINIALDNGDFELYHQPQIDLKTMRVCGSECLIRWQHNDEGFIPPDIFIPIAEDMGLINRLTQWVIHQALYQHSEILAAGNKHHMVSINISGKDITAEGFYEFVVESIEQTEISPNRIAFELTESATITDNEQALGVINKLNELGITISIDDFGTGYSSMAYISKLPFQELKVDRQFVENVCDDSKRKTIAETTVKMAKGLGLEVVAEGINSQLDEDTLRGFGTDIGQGYYYAKPMAFDDYINWLSEEVNGRKPELEGEFIPKPG